MKMASLNKKKRRAGKRKNSGFAHNKRRFRNQGQGGFEGAREQTGSGEEPRATKRGMWFPDRRGEQDGSDPGEYRADVTTREIRGGRKWHRRPPVSSGESR